LLTSDRSETVFEDFKAALTPAQAVTEANRCLYCADAPCIQACPTSIDIPQFIRKIATGNVKGSARTIFDSNILGMSCARVCPVEVLCAGACVYNHRGEDPIAIGKLQRYVTDQAYAEGWRFFSAGPDTGKSVGLIGAGPASLAAAHELRRAGHRVTIYDKRKVTGGLNTTGVAPYKMKSDRALAEWEWVTAIGGIEVQTGVEIGRDLTWDALRSKHQALFLGFGLGEDTRLQVPGEQLPGVYGAVELIEKFKLGKLAFAEVKHAVVVGGGNTALDAVRELKGLGVPEVTLLYRGVESAMSGYAHEWEAAKIENVRALWQTQPIAVEGTTKVTGLKCVRLDDAKKAIPGTEHSIPADLVMLAIGQAKLASLAASLPGLKIDKGTIVTDAHGATGCAGVFAGGDCRNGGKEVVNAAAEGKTAARAISQYLGAK
jgi:dihydropyrimidine dehydrogenase (NAD+) subunit PreT